MCVFVCVCEGGGCVCVCVFVHVTESERVNPMYTVNTCNLYTCTCIYMYLV